MNMLQQAEQQREEDAKGQRGRLGLNLQKAHEGDTDDLMQQVLRLSTKVQAQEAEKRVMAEESFQIEQILKRQYHADIRAKTEQNQELKRANEILIQQLETLNGECEGLRGAVAIAEEILEGFFERRMRPLPKMQAEKTEANGRVQGGLSDTRMRALFAALSDAVQTEGEALDDALQQLWPEASESLYLSKAPSATVEQSAAERAPSTSVIAQLASEGPPPGSFEAAAKGEALGHSGSPSRSSETQLENLKAQIERLRENLGTFTEGVLNAHRRHLRAQKPCAAPAPPKGVPSEKVRPLEMVETPLPETPARRPRAPTPEERPAAPEKSGALLRQAAAAEGAPPGGPPVHVLPPLHGVSSKAKALWGSGSRSSPPSEPQPFPPVERVRGAVLLPAAQVQLRQRQRQSLCSGEGGGWRYCMPPSGGLGPCEAFCDGGAGPKPGVVLPPLRHRQLHTSGGPSSRRRGPPSGGSHPPSGPPVGLLNASASASTLLPALKSASAAPVRPSKGGLAGSVSAVDLSVVGRPLGPPPPAGAPAVRRRGARAAPTRTRRSSSPIRGKAFGSGMSGQASAEEAVCPADILAIESKVSSSAADSKETLGPLRGASLRAPTPAKDNWRPLRPSAAGSHLGAYPVHCGLPPLYANTPSRNPSPSSGLKSDWGGLGPYGELRRCDSTTRLVPAAAGYQGPAPTAARFVSPSEFSLPSNSQPPRSGSPMKAGGQLRHSLRLQLQQQGFPLSLISPSVASVSANQGLMRTPINACSPLQSRYICPTDRRPPPFSAVSTARGCSRGCPSPGVSRIGGPWGPCGLISPLCYSNPPLRSPTSSNRSGSNIHSIQRQRQKEEGADWVPSRP
ncbi:hypothetical protein cyc_03665 [Cyclospora cayetanensis]|uniref:Uncharacterized protein n=1 Tax=Cyclospora cayetanensis TaxID=88456 RepID=A0A1D3D9Y0_9EIME|nr:hypothetical protein cyc_03665 [Cyclospora cayetanensis]